jgi:hypothetical protein
VAAALSDSGISDNGISGNGIIDNGISGNGISGNGISGNGISGNGISGDDISGDRIHGNCRCRICCSNRQIGLGNGGIRIGDDRIALSRNHRVICGDDRVVNNFRIVISDFSAIRRRRGRR